MTAIVSLEFRPDATRHFNLKLLVAATGVRVVSGNCGYPALRSIRKNSQSTIIDLNADSLSPIFRYSNVHNFSRTQNVAENFSSIFFSKSITFLVDSNLKGHR